MKFSVLERYKGIVVSVALFLLLDASVLMLNFYVSFEIAEDAAGINLAGRQRMLSQRMTKSLLDMQYSINSEAESEKAFEELQLTQKLFQQTLTAFDVGGTVKGAGGQEVSLAAVTSSKGRASIEEAKTLWLPYAKHLSAVLSMVGNDEAASGLLITAIDYARKNNLQLLTLMNDLTVDLEQVAQSKASRLRLIQTVGISLAILNFFLILFHFLRQLRESDEVIEAARKETTEILETVNEGLFLLDENFLIGSQYSKALEEMLGCKEIAGVSFNLIIQDIISPKDMEAAYGFVGLLFKQKVKEKLIQDLNPLDEVQVSVPNTMGGFDTRYLSFSFTRVYVEEKIQHVLVSVIDKTDKVVLAKKLESEQEQSDLQLEMLTSILHTNAELLRGFIDNTFATVNTLNGLLKKTSKNEAALRDKLVELYREIHNFKGESSALGLHSFTSIGHELENTLEAIKQLPTLSGNDFLVLTMGIDELISHTQLIDKLVTKLEGFSKQPDSAETDQPSLTNYLFTLASGLSERNGKPLTLYCSGFDDVELSAEQREWLTAISTQLLRNAVVHGIETSENRNLAQKVESARIDMQFTRNSNGDFELSVKDDGQGIDREALKEKLVSEGLVKPESIESWDDKRLLSSIFKPGFSTAQQVSEDAGRGMGMDIVSDRVKACGGRIQLASKSGRYTLFKIIVPGHFLIARAA